MAEVPSDYLTVAEWAHARIVDLTLGGRKVRYRVPDLDAYIAYGIVPNPLYSLAVRVERGITPEFEDTLDPDERRAYRELRCHIIATHLEEPNLVAEMGEEAAVKWVDEQMPPGHRDLLWSYSVTHIDPEGELRSLLDRLPFRRQQAGAGAPSDRQEVGTEAE